MMTTLGATISKTLAKALFNWWTTSLPCSAAAAGIVDIGALSGVAAKIDIMPSPTKVREIRSNRIGSRLDSIQHATFKPVVQSLFLLQERANYTANGLTGDILSVGSLRICDQSA